MNHMIRPGLSMNQGTCMNVVKDQILNESDEDELISVGENRKRFIESDSDESETASVIEIESDSDQSANDAAVAFASSSVARTSKTIDKTDHIAIKSSRERVARHKGVKSVTIDLFSVVLYRFINVTKDLALMDIKGHAKTFQIPFQVKNGKLVLNPLTKSTRTSLIELLKERMALYDFGVSPDLVELLLDPAQWTPYDVYFVCLNIGEVMNQKGKLIGSLKGNKMGNIFLSSRKSGFQRSHIVLLASGQQRPSDDHTADHIVSSQTLNDSISNLR
jgi:hypothetical protein